jgi:undecaprenyl-diphosphatase
MAREIFLAVIQAATEFLPVSSSGHLALVSGLISEPDVFFFTVLHLSSLIAVVIFTKEEILHLVRFEAQYGKMWMYVIIATVPAALFGFFFKGIIERSFSSLLFLGTAFIFTGFVLFVTKFARTRSALNAKNSLLIGLCQVLALFPGISRSGITISSALFLGIEKEKAVKFSFLFKINEKPYVSLSLLVSFFVCLILSLFFLNLLFFIVKRGKLWVFSIYCFMIGALSLLLHFLKFLR